MKLHTRLLSILAVVLLLSPGFVSAESNQLTRVSAWVSTRTPAQNTNVFAFVQVSVDGKFRSGLAVTFTWKFKSGAKTCSGKTDKRGIAYCKLNIGTAPYGARVIIDAALTADSQSQKAVTSFTPTRPGATSGPTPTRTPEAKLTPTPARPNG